MAAALLRSLVIVVIFSAPVAVAQTRLPTPTPAKPRATTPAKSPAAAPAKNVRKASDLIRKQEPVKIFTGQRIGQSWPGVRGYDGEAVSASISCFEKLTSIRLNTVFLTARNKPSQALFCV